MYAHSGSSESCACSDEVPSVLCNGELVGNPPPPPPGLKCYKTSRRTGASDLSLVNRKTPMAVIHQIAEELWEPSKHL